MSTSIWEHYFKPDIRTAGRSFVTKGKVTCSRLSDTEVQSYIKASTAFKVILKSDSVSSAILVADCSCPLSKKGQFCKHIWAALVVTEQKFSDFLESKTEIEKKGQPLFEVSAKTVTDTKRLESQKAYKAKQAEHRKDQYQRQKDRLKEQKKSKKRQFQEISFPPAVESALNYFSANGFDLKQSINSEAVGYAKKKLSRVFHPDIGGSHDEIQELNQFAEILLKYAKS